MNGRRFFVAGRVQGVFFRACTATRARELGLTGHARNLDDGRVEVVAFGDHDRIAALGDWLWQGSPESSVTAVDSESVRGQAPPAFTTG